MPESLWIPRENNQVPEKVALEVDSLLPYVPTHKLKIKEEKQEVASGDSGKYQCHEIPGMPAVDTPYPQYDSLFWEFFSLGRED